MALDFTLIQQGNFTPVNISVSHHPSREHNWSSFRQNPHERKVAVNKLDLQKWKAFDCKLESPFQIDAMKPHVAIIFE